MELIAQSRERVLVNWFSGEQLLHGLGATLHEWAGDSSRSMDQLHHIAQRKQRSHNGLPRLRATGDGTPSLQSRPFAQTPRAFEDRDASFERGASPSRPSSGARGLRRQAMRYPQSESPHARSAGQKVDMLHCSPMATEVPQRELRNNTASLLRRVATGERLRITVHGNPVAELVPIDRPDPFVPFDELVSELRGKMLPDDHLDEELRDLDEAPQDPFA